MHNLGSRGTGTGNYCVGDSIVLSRSGDLVETNPKQNVLISGEELIKDYQECDDDDDEASDEEDVENDDDDDDRRYNTRKEHVIEELKKDANNVQKEVLSS